MNITVFGSEIETSMLKMKGGLLSIISCVRNENSVKIDDILLTESPRRGDPLILAPDYSSISLSQISLALEQYLQDILDSSVLVALRYIKKAIKTYYKVDFNICRETLIFLVIADVVKDRTETHPFLIIFYRLPDGEGLDSQIFILG